MLPSLYNWFLNFYFFLSSKCQPCSVKNTLKVVYLFYLSSYKSCSVYFNDFTKRGTSAIINVHLEWISEDFIKFKMQRILNNNINKIKMLSAQSA